MKLLKAWSALGKAAAQARMKLRSDRREHPRGSDSLGRLVRPSLTRAQREVLDAIVKDTHGGKSWMNPRNLPHWVKNPWQACQILERKGYVESQWIVNSTCYRPNAEVSEPGGPARPTSRQT